MNDTQDELATEGAPRKPRKGIYVLPNAITLAALFSGFYAIVMAMNGRFDLACAGIFSAMVLDSLVPQVHRSGTWPSYANPKVRYVRGDVRDRSVFEPLVLAAEAVVHFGAAVSIGQSMYEYSEASAGVRMRRNDHAKSAAVSGSPFENVTFFLSATVQTLPSDVCAGPSASCGCGLRF